MNPTTSEINISAPENVKLSRVIPVTIGDQLCYPRFTCIHLDFPGDEQLKKNLARYRQKEILIHLFECANNFDASDEELHSEFFGTKQDGIRIVWEYINMMLMQLGGQEFLSKYPKDNAIFQELTAFYGRHGSLPIIAEKNIIALFRKCMIYDNAVEDIQPVQISRSSIKAVIEERKSDNMETEECEYLQTLFLSPAEKFMMEFDGSSKDLRGLFKIPKENVVIGSLHQQICNTAKNQFDLEQRAIALFGLQFTEDEQIGNWISRTNGRFKTKEIPKSCHGMMELNKNKVQFNFLKNLEIKNINMEVDQLHTSTHEFWEEENIKESLMQFLVGWSRNQKAYVKKVLIAQDEATYGFKNDDKEEDTIELGFVDGLFELYKLRCEIETSRAEIMATKMLSGYRHNFGSFLFNSFICFRSSTIENLIEDKRKELNDTKRMEASKIAYEFLILQHTAIKCVLEQKYDELINVTIFEKFIMPNLKRRYSQYTIVALTRACAIMVNQQLLQAFMARKNNQVRRIKLDLKNKEEQQKQKLIQMQKPTTLAIKEQVSAEVCELLRQANEEPTSGKTSNTKIKSGKRKNLDLAQLISKSTRDAKRHTKEENVSLQVEEEGEETGLTKKKRFNKKTNFGRI